MGFKLFATYIIMIIIIIKIIIILIIIITIIIIIIIIIIFIVRLSLLTMTNPNQLCGVLLFVSSKMAVGTNLSSKLPVADRTRDV